jgi:predicted nucleic acid-binding Zn ribbon protein
MADAQRPESAPEAFNDVLARLFAARGWGRLSERTRLETAWKEAAGVEIEPHTRVGSIRRGVMEIEVKNAVLIQELTQFHKRRILAELRKRLTGVVVTDLKFRAGTW